MADSTNLRTDHSGQVRCSWCGDDPLYVAYHDIEWGFPVVDDQRLFEKICLEGFQAGLSWLTILRKRDSFRQAFADFDFPRVAKFDEQVVERLLADKSIVRHRGKIESTINNARRAIELRREFGSLAAFFWQYEPRTPPQSKVVRSTSPESLVLSQELKRRGWTYIGPTTAYAFMQAMGLVNDHHVGCEIRKRVAACRMRLDTTGI